MEKRKLLKYSTVFMVFFIANGSLVAAGESSENPAVNSPAGEVKSRFFDSAGIRPGANISEGKLLIEVQSITFDSRWDAEQWRQIDPDYEERIQSSYSVLLKQKLSEAFDEAGFTVVGEPEEATISVLAFVTRLSINTPELEGVSPNMNEPAGAAEIRLDLVRRSDQQLLARLTSFRRTEFDETLPPREAKPCRNRHDFANLMGLWARESATYLSKPTTSDREPREVTGKEPDTS